MCNDPPSYKGTLCLTDDTSKNFLLLRENKFGNTFIDDIIALDMPVITWGRGAGDLRHLGDDSKAPCLRELPCHEKILDSRKTSSPTTSQSAL